MEEWKVYKIKDICKGIYEGPHATPKESQTGGIYLGIPAISVDGHINFRNAKRIAEEDLPLWTKRVTPQEDDIVFTNEATLNLYALIPAGFHGCLGRRLGLVRPNNEIVNAKYLFYYFFSPEWRNVISQNKVYGATVERILMTKFPSFPIKLPSLSVQNSIVNILSSLDDKIEVNRRINENLEQQAQALFKSWFVDFEPFRDSEFVESELGMIPKGWRVGSLFDVAEIFDKIRKPLSGKERENMDKIYPYYGATSCMDYVDNYLFDGIYTLIGEDGSVAKENGFPYMQYVWGKFWVNNHAHILQGKNGFSTEMIHVFLSMTNIQHLVTGAVQAKLSQANMQKISLPIPPKDIVDNIRPRINVMYEKKRILEQESRRLAELRDTLLPKLMSGELKVNELNI